MIQKLGFLISSRLEILNVYLKKQHLIPKLITYMLNIAKLFIVKIKNQLNHISHFYVSYPWMLQLKNQQ